MAATRWGKGEAGIGILPETDTAAETVRTSSGGSWHSYSPKRTDFSGRVIVQMSQMWSPPGRMADVPVIGSDADRPAVHPAWLRVPLRPTGTS